MKSDKEKAREILKKRDDAQKGIEHDTEGEDSIRKEEKREEKIADNGFALGVGLKRT